MKARVAWNKGKKNRISEEGLERLRESRKRFTGENHPRYGVKLSEETKNKISEANKNYNKNNKAIWLGKHHTEESKKKIGEKSKGKKHSEEFKEKQRQRLLNGQAVMMNKCITKLSKPELKLREIVKLLYPNCEFQYKVFNYSLDIALIEKKIAIEYDGWYHFDSKESIERHNRRQKQIEEQGWKFLRYNIFQPFPDKEKVINDIQLI
jgi:very-short-patch-repair endonuclease